MCKLCASAFTLLACLALADAFFLPVFLKKQEPQTPAVSSNANWARAPMAAAPQTYKDYQSYAPQMSQMSQMQAQLQPVPMASMQQYTYETPSMMMTPYHQMQLQPQFHNVQLVPCMCPLTRDVIEQQTQNMMQSMQASAPQPSSDSTKLGVVQGASKNS